MLLTIDPGVSTGWALWRQRALVGCGLGDPRACKLHLAENVETVWIESPVLYPHSKARPADILQLSREAGRWAGIYSVFAADVHFVEPANWKGQLKKKVHHPRIWAKLNANERDILHLAGKGVLGSKLHNVLDAVGLGLWVLKRDLNGPR